MLSKAELRQKVLYPVVRVRTDKAGGSGVLIYSKPDSKDEGKFINVILTCQHVVDDCIKVKKEWNPVAQADRKRDIMEEVTVELFDYDNSKVLSANATKGNIIGYDAQHDIAAVRLYDPRPHKFVAELIPEEAIAKLELPDPVWTSGCSLLHEPFMNPGTATFLREIIDQKEYLMSNAPSIFGNSGGGLFHGDTGYLLGLTSRITSIQLGFGTDVMTWMGFSSHPKRFYEFFREQELHFLFDEKDDYYSAMSRREKRKKEALRAVLTGADDESETPKWRGSNPQDDEE